MGAYKSRPMSSCSEAWLKRVRDSYITLRARVTQDMTVSKDKELSALQQACCNDDIDEILQLISETNIHERTSNGLTLLHLCCLDGGCKSVIRFLARVGAFINSLSVRGFTALHVASFKGDIELVGDLLMGGADVGRMGYASITALHLACLCGHAQVAELLLRYDADPHAQDALMFTPLHCACFCGHDQVVKCLINHSADINMSSEVGLCPLHLACSKGFLTVAKLLITGRKNNKADVNAYDNEKNTPLHYSARTGHIVTLNHLLDPACGVKGQEVNIYGDTALHVACYHGRLDVTKELVLRLGQECLAVENIFSETPLHSACTYGKNLDIVRFLVEQPGVDVNHQGRDGHTALHSACYHGHIQVVQLLLDHGANVELACSEDVISSHAQRQTCLDWAEKGGHDGIVALLKKVSQEMLPRNGED
ncbi:serine/threonine-protein kinase TNNI3K-like [Acanthaster planci]|uniref:Serine/threonine-protein kinase TNNI3K-like n=1 Tax=Acanthaster planci TaxID=133434 RepID=A0A8B7ZGS1_ACAPL|nr:serine/threonine-protein kinase TNNI3K-like [Acanthaster planci]XP_022104854.1 serine/threonine-protein kinase TNNI3K-like [Acanthaster planci]